jgi:hypothetical protein
MTASFICLNHIQTPETVQGRLFGVCKMLARIGFAAGLWIALTGAAAAQQSEVLFSHKH